jgi:hypothetical protein
MAAALSRDRAPGVAYEQRQEVELLRPQTNLLAGTPHAPGRAIDDHVAGAHRLIALIRVGDGCTA